MSFRLYAVVVVEVVYETRRDIERKRTSKRALRKRKRRERYHDGEGRVEFEGSGGEEGDYCVSLFFVFGCRWVGEG